MLTLITSTWGIWLIGAICGGTLTYGLGYDVCFKERIEIDRDIEYLMMQRQEFLEMARKELRGESIGNMSNEYYQAARKFSVKVGTHDN